MKAAEVSGVLLADNQMGLVANVPDFVCFYIIFPYRKEVSGVTMDL